MRLIVLDRASKKVVVCRCKKEDLMLVTLGLRTAYPAPEFTIETRTERKGKA